MKIRFLLVLLALLMVVPASGPAAERTTGKVTFNFVDVDLGAVAKFVSEVTGKNFIFDERVRGNITIIAPTPISAGDAFALFSSVLSLKGLALIPSGVDAYKIVPDSEARQSGVRVSEDGPPMDESYVARLIPLRNISSDEALRFLQPVVSKTGYISSFGPGNTLLLVDTGLNVEKVLGIIEGIDRPGLQEDPDVVFLEHAGAEALAKMMNEGMQKQAGRKDASAARAVADSRLNAVVLFGDRSEKEAMKRLLGRLDVAPREAQGAINVHFLENADAEELAEVLDKLLAGEAAGAPGAPGAPGQVRGRSPFESATAISITPDKATNSLLVVASPADYQSILQVIRQLDRPRRQVFVEAMILEASMDELRELGSRWRVSASHDGEPIAIGGVGVVDGTTIQNILQGLQGMTVGGVGSYFDVPVVQPDGSTTTLSVPGFAALFSLSEFEGAVNVLSSPQILTSDNTEAEIVVGQNVPFVAKQERDITTTNTVLSSIERTDVGIKLRITPQITEGAAVKLDIYQEISSLIETSDEVATTVGPTTTMRSTRTTVVVRDGETVAIGGLMQEEELESETRVPLLHRIPVLGWLFKYRSASKVKTNLMVFLTPHIVKNSRELASLTEEKSDIFAQVVGRFVPGELLVKFRADVSGEEIAGLIEARGASVISVMEGIGVYHIRLAEGSEVDGEMEAFEALPQVEYAEPNFVLDLRGGGQGGRVPGGGGPTLQQVR
jgi:general secretion pathway protein D